MEGLIIGLQKRRIEKYKKIVQVLFNKEELSEEQKEFLKKEKLIE